MAEALAEAASSIAVASPLIIFAVFKLFPSRFGVEFLSGFLANVLLAETGLPGLVLFLAVIWSTVLGAERTRRRAKIRNPAGAMQLYYMELGLLGYLVAGIWGSYGQLVLTYLHIAVIYATAQVLKEEGPAVALAAPRRRLHPTPRSMPAAVRGRGR